MDSQKLSSAQALRAHSANIERAKQVISARLAELDRRSPAKDAAEVAALREAVDKLADTQRRFAGRFDARMGKPREQVLVDGELVDDDELKAFLQLQSAPPAGP